MWQLESISNYFKSIPGFHTKRKIIVFESDDWGSIRMPSLDVFNKMIKEGFDTSQGPSGRYNKYDSLATYDDLYKLFEVLASVRDCNGNHFVMTPMCLVANPDFDKIEASGFRTYYYEPFTLTLQKYENCERSFELWKEGISSGIFIPQFHGREHLNIRRWLEALQMEDKDAHLAFKYRFWGYPRRSDSYMPIRSFQASFEIDNPSELENLNKIISDGLKLFNQLFGYSAKCFTPPNGPLNHINEKMSAQYGIKYLQTARVIYYEPIGSGKTRRSLRYLGKRNQYNQLYFVRNCFFEPSEISGFDWVDKCLNDIRIAFSYNKPAIISSHRVNYIGALIPENRDRGLKQLKELIDKILKTYPNVEFLTSPQLGDLLTENGSQKN